MNKYIKIIGSILYILSSTLLYAQQDPQFTHNVFNRVGVNPGAAGLNKATCFNLFARQQWTNFNGAPSSALLTADMPIAQNTPLHGGLGVVIGADKQGFENTLNARLAYAYHLKLGAGTLGLGVDAGVLNYGLKGNWIAPDGTIGIGDPLIPQNGLNSSVFDLGLGAFYNSDKYYLGFSSTHIPASAITKKVNTTNFKYTLARHFYLNTGFNWDLNKTITLKPNLFVKATTGSIIFDINVLAYFNNFIWAGLTYRNTDAIAALVGFQFKSFKLGYSYDYTTSKLNKSRGGSSNGTHEVYLGYCFKQTKKTDIQRSKTVRFL